MLELVKDYALEIAEKHIASHSELLMNAITFMFGHTWLLTWGIIPFIIVVLIIKTYKVAENIENKTKTDKVNEIELPEERGLLDFLVDFEEANQNIIDCTTRMTNITNILSQKINTRTAESKKYNKKSGSTEAWKHLRGIAQKAASDMFQYAKDIEKELSRLHRSWDDLEENAVSLIKTADINNPEDREGMIAFRSSIEKSKMQ